MLNYLLITYYVVVGYTWLATRYPLRCCLPFPPQQDRGSEHGEKTHGLRKGLGDHSPDTVTDKTVSAWRLA